MDHTKIYYLHYGDNIPFYVGKTKNNLNIRANSHKKRFGKKIKIEEIDIVLLKEWKFWETYWIEQFKTWGFILLNKNEGGGGPISHSQETKDKMSKIKKGLPSNSKGSKWSEESINNLKNHPTRNKTISKNSKGLSKSHKGKKFTEEHKQKIKTTRGFLKGRKNTWQSKAILQYDLEGNFIKEWSSQTEATVFLNKNGNGIGACCREKQKSSYGYIWRFKE
jgi:hypothetical protein